MLEREQLAGVKPLTDPYFFSDAADAGEPWDTHRIAASSAGPGIGSAWATCLHDLRHFVASMLADDASIPIGVIAARLGHALKSTTLNMYVHYVDGQDVAAAAALGARLAGALSGPYRATTAELVSRSLNRTLWATVRPFSRASFTSASNRPSSTRTTSCRVSSLRRSLTSPTSWKATGPAPDAMGPFTRIARHIAVMVDHPHVMRCIARSSGQVKQNTPRTGRGVHRRGVRSVNRASTSDTAEDSGNGSSA